MRSAKACASWCVVELRKVSASECRLVFSVVSCGGAGTTNDDIFVSKSVLFEECTERGNKGGALLLDSSCCPDDVGEGFVILLLIIFSSIRARTLTLAVCKGGPPCSFFSDFLFSASYMGKMQ